MNYPKISKAIIRRLPKYRRYLGQLKRQGVEKISSNELSELIGCTASQIRQDFNTFGEFGQQGYGQALKTSGDAVFPVIMGAVFMYLAAVGGTYFFGIHLGLLAAGAYIAMASDECARAVGMVLRWKSGKWKLKRLVD